MFVVEDVCGITSSASIFFSALDAVGSASMADFVSIGHRSGRAVFNTLISVSIVSGSANGWLGCGRASLDFVEVSTFGTDSVVVEVSVVAVFNAVLSL